MTEAAGQVRVPTRRDPPAPAHDARYIPGLDGLRAVAILAVLFSHQFVQYEGEDQLRGIAHAIESLASRSGMAGVRLFFAISGFLICSRLLTELTRARPGAALRSFYIRRAFRILPPIVPYLALLWIARALGWLQVGGREIAAAALFVANYITGKSWYTHHFWTLAVEEHFYLLWAPLLAFAGRRRAAIVAAGIIVVTAIVRPIVLARVADPRHAMQLTHLELDAFMFPCLLAILLGHPAVRARAASVAGDVAMLGLVALLGFVSMIPGRLAVPGFDPTSLQGLCLALLVAAPGLAPRSLSTRALEWRPLTWVGRRSYGIYIWQQLIFIPSTASLSHKVLSFVVRTAGVLLIAEISFRLLERPLLARGRSLAARFAPVHEPDRDDARGADDPRIEPAVVAPGAS